MKVLYVATEGLPFVKTGGLADVIGSLPKIMTDNKIDARVVLPLYLNIAIKYRDTFDKLATFEVKSGDIDTVATVYSTKVGKVIYYFIEHQNYFERETLYGYGDDGERFAFFAKAVLEMLQNIKFYPDVMHLNDWHTGIVPIINKVHYANVKKMMKIKFVYTIHNILFQGYFPKSIMGSCLGLSEEYFYNGLLRFNDGVSYMKAGIVVADKVTTVSSTYAHEILTPEFGENLENVLRLRENDLSGIVNGIDLDLYNPETDKTLVKNYSVDNYVEGKKANKQALQEKLGLRKDNNVLLIGIVSRLTNQKGLNLILEQIGNIMKNDVQFVCLGSGDSHIENALRNVENEYPHRAVYYCGYNEQLANLIYAGSDIFLMPSNFEPCGISQLIAMRYGSLPLIRETGGLKDTVMPYNQYTDEGCGFSFSSYSSHDMMSAIGYAMYVYYNDKPAFNRLIKRAMNKDFSWTNSCLNYIDIYKELTNKTK